MTRTEITRKELEETKRHNQQQEFIGKLGAIVDVGKMVYGKGGLAGLFPRNMGNDLRQGSASAAPNRTRKYNRRSYDRKGD